MKKSLQLFKVLFVVLTTMVGFKVSAQTSCSVGTHQVFAETSKEAPKVLNKLGTKPQFGEIPKNTALSAYQHLGKVNKSNVRRSRVELDSYLKALGYTGYKDPAFSAASITPVVLKAGTRGWMGAFLSKGHSYKWSELGKDFEAFKLTSKDGSCSSYIMKKCGNIFFDPSVRCITCTECDPNFNDPIKCPKPVTCKSQTLNIVGNGKIQGGDVINTTKTFPLVATFNGQTVCLGDYSVPVRISYEMNATGQINYSKPIQVCDFGAGVPANNTLNIPMAMSYKANSSEVSVGQDGRINMPIVDEKQFNALKKAFGTCASSPTAVAASNTCTATTTTTAVPANMNSTTAAGSNNCVKQTININGIANSEAVTTQTATQEVTMIGMYKKLGKLDKGETAEKYMCLGTYQVPSTTCIKYGLANNSKLSTQLDVCDNGSVKPVDELNVPVTMTANFTKQNVNIGDYGKVYVALTEKQYKALSKAYSRCCSGGNGSANCN